MKENFGENISVIQESDISKLAEQVTGGGMDIQKIIPELRKMKGKRTDQDGDALMSFAMAISDQYREGERASMLAYHLSQILSETL